MTQTEVELIRVGNALARSVGHAQGCPKLAPGMPCLCHAAREQAGALDNWLHLVREIESAL